MDQWNKKLKRQLWKHFGEEKIPENLTELMVDISKSYDTYEKEHTLLIE